MTYIAIGTITKPHGVKGALSIKTDSDFKTERYAKGNTLYIQHKSTYLPVTVKGFFEKGSVDVLSFNEFDNINQVEAYRGCTVYVLDSDRKALEEDTYYYSDLMGLKVLTTELIGVVSEVRTYPQGEVLVVKRENQKDVLIPFRKEFIKEVTEEAIYLIEWEGLL